MNFINEWYSDISRRPSLDLQRAIRVEGIRQHHAGPHMEFAKIEVLAEPSTSLIIACSSGLNNGDHQELFLRAAVFGMLDVLLVSEPSPLRNVRLTVVGYQEDPIDSSQMAFRHAGRDAGRNILIARTEQS